jgi:hypothetical protein
VKQLTPEQFANKTALLISVLLEPIIHGHNLIDEEIEWFTAHCEARFCYFYARDPAWRKWLENRSMRIDPRLQCQTWMRHWWAAYAKGPEEYQRRYAIVT